MSPIVPPYTEKRRVPRSRVFRKARCVVDTGGLTLDVTIRDISLNGARITGEGLDVLPQTFEVRILDGYGRYSSRQARLVWARGRTAGLEFLD